MARKSPHDWVGQMKKKERERERNWDRDLCRSEGAVEKNVSDFRSPLNGGTEGELHPQRRAQPPVCRRKMERGLPA